MLAVLWRIQLRDHFCVAQNWISYQFEASNRLSVFVSDAIDVGGFHEACNPVELELSSFAASASEIIEPPSMASNSLCSPVSIRVNQNYINYPLRRHLPENLIETMSNMRVDPQWSFCFIKMFNRILLSRFEYFCGASTSCCNLHCRTRLMMNIFDAKFSGNSC